jgi:hypothetical protein
MTRSLTFVCALAVATPSLAQGSAPDAGISPADQQLLQEIEAAQARTPPAPPPAAASQAGPAARAANFFSNVFNPAMSVNGLFLASGTSQQDPAEGTIQNGVAIQEIEAQFLANVDPYFSANIILSLPGGEGIEVEEGYLLATPQPFGLSLRFGKVKVPFGRENPFHTHALPFINKSLVGEAVFGEEGLGEVGVEGSYLTPLPFYTLLTFSLLDGGNEVMFASPHSEDLAGFGGLKSVFDLTDDATLEAGASYVVGKNAAAQLSQVAGGHLVFKWKPARDATTSSAVVALEGMLASRPTREDEVEPPAPATTAGFYGYVQWQLDKRWFASARFDYLSQAAVGPEMDVTLRETAILVFAPTEFSALRLQASVTHPPGGGDPVFEGLLQANFTLGSHPAHLY